MYQSITISKICYKVKKKKSKIGASYRMVCMCVFYVCIYTYIYMDMYKIYSEGYSTW